MNFFISSASAAAATPAPGSGDSTFSMFMIAAIFVLFYFMLIRPQNKRAKEHREMIGQLKKGDEIVTSGGILAKINHLDEQYMKVELAEGLIITMQRNAISSVLPKGTLKTL